MPTGHISRVLVASVAALAIGGLMVLSATRTLAVSTQQEALLTQKLVTDAMASGLSTESIAAAGVTPSSVPNVLEALRRSNAELQIVRAKAAALTFSTQSRDAISNEIRGFGLTDELDEARDAAHAAIESASEELAAAVLAWTAALGEELGDYLTSAQISGMTRSILNSGRKVPHAFRVLPPDTTDWTALEKAFAELDAVSVAELQPDLRNTWLTAHASPDVAAATASLDANHQAVRIALAQIFQQLPAN